MMLAVSTPSDTSPEIVRHMARWRAESIIARIWRKDPTVWADPPVSEIADRLGWLDAHSTSRELVEPISRLHAAAVSNGITDIVLCGMGGSSLAPEVFAATLPVAAGSPELTVIDSTHPDAVRAVSRDSNPETTWYLIASKSGGTIETMSLYRFFWDQASRSLTDPGSHFIAITDPGTSLETLAADRGFRATLLADPDVGGRYSALTAFGLVPAGLIGADISDLLDAGSGGATQCGPDISLEENPGFAIGVFMAEHARSGRDKAQFIASNPTEAVGIWIEQLVAESTGKHGLGIVPIDGGPRLDGSPTSVTVGIGAEPPGDTDIRITVEHPHGVAALMFVLEFATAVAGEILGINPFDQPDVQMAKQLASRAMGGDLDSSGVVPISVSKSHWAETLKRALADRAASYISIQAYIPQTPENTSRLDALRRALSEVSGAYVTIGFGPRFLHSTGQLHKGGPPGGVYLQIIDDTGSALEVPGAGYTFNELIAAQARGDRAALADSDRSVIAVDLGPARDQGLNEMLLRIQQIAIG